MFSSTIISAEKLDVAGVAVNPAASIDFVTLDDAKAYLEIADGAQDVEVARLVSLASEAIETYLDRHIYHRRVTEIVTLDTPVRTVVLRNYPMRAVVSVSDIASGTPIVIAAPSYRASLDRGIIHRAPAFSDLWCGAYEFVCDVGWPAAEIPAALKHGCMELVKAIRMQRRRDPDIAIENDKDVGEVQYIWAMSSASEAVALMTGRHGGVVPITVANIINPYKRRT